MNSSAKWWVGLGAVLLAVPLGFELLRVVKVSPAPSTSVLPEEDRAAALAFSALHRCWLGEPLGPDEGAAPRARKLVVATAPSSSPDAWPGRCAPLARVYAELRAKRGNSELSAEDKRLVEALTAGMPVLSLSEAMLFEDDWHREASKLAPSAEVPAAHSPLTPAVAVGQDEIAALGQAFARDRLGVYWGVASGRVCAIANDGHSIRCSPLADRVGVESQEPTFVGEGLLAELRLTPKPVNAVVELDTGELLASSSLTIADATRVGAATFFIAGPPQELGYRDKGGKVVSRKLPRGHNKLVDGHLVTQGDRILVSPLSDQPSAAPPIDVGPSPKQAKAWQGPSCRSGDVHYTQLDQGGVLRHDKAGWILLKSPASGQGMSCDERSVQFVTRTASDGLGHQRCDEKACEETSAELEIDWWSRLTAVAACPDRAIWIREARGGLWASVAKVGELERATPQLLMYAADLRDGTPRFDFVAAVPVEGGALVIAWGDQRATVVRVGCDGKATRTQASATEKPLRSAE